MRFNELEHRKNLRCATTTGRRGRTGAGRPPWTCRASPAAAAWAIPSGPNARGWPPNRFCARYKHSSTL
jgi:hypothetical protein